MPELDDRILALMCQIDSKLDRIQETVDYHTSSSTGSSYGWRASMRS
jgi:hypothetical protein